MGLLDALRASQERIVVAGEEERRRLRRDLHDGLGPALAALTLAVDAVRNEVRAGRPRSELDERLVVVRGGIQATVFDVRRIVEGLRPPAIDELGLVDAVRQLAVGLHHDGLDIRIEADPFPPFSAAAEVAIYRIVQEALTDIVRHAHARRAIVDLAFADDVVVLTISDDGSGVVADHPDGVGLHSTRERAASLGGERAVDAREGTGTTVTARLPVAARATQPRAKIGAP
jgi:signal transduction histidine kinase